MIPTSKQKLSCLSNDPKDNRYTVSPMLSALDRETRSVWIISLAKYMVVKEEM